MIIWIASYPKSGNTYIRSFLASYYYSENGKFSFDHLLKIHQFPNMKFSQSKTSSKEEASKNWIFNQNIFLIVPTSFLRQIDVSFFLYYLCRNQNL